MDHQISAELPWRDPMPLLGQTVDTGRVRDIIAVAHPDKDDEAVGTPHMTLIGRGQSGVLCAYAALYVPSVKEVILYEPSISHKDGPIFLNVLRVLDIPEAARNAGRRT